MLNYKDKLNQLLTSFDSRMAHLESKFQDDIDILEIIKYSFYDNIIFSKLYDNLLL